MKWSVADSDEKSTSTPAEQISRRHTGRLISLLRHSMEKRKHAFSSTRLLNKQETTLSDARRNVFRCVHPAKRFCNSLITKEELSAFQIQLAILSDSDGDRPIHIAVANENTELVRKLILLMLKNSISLDITNYLRQTPLHLAVIVGNLEIIQLLLSYGACPQLCDRNGNSVLHLAVKSHSNKEVLQLLLSHPPVKNILNSMDYEGYSALHYAVFKNNANAIQMLQTFGADLNKIDGKSGRTALIHAVLEQKSDIVDLLLNCGACPRVTDYSGRSAFEMALQVANVQIATQLESRMPRSEVTALKEQVKPIKQHSAKHKRTRN